MIVQIEPITTGTLTIDSVDLTVTYYNLEGGCVLRYTSISENVMIETGIIKLTTEEINNWGTDDNYIINIALDKLNMTKILPNY